MRLNLQKRDKPMNRKPMRGYLFAIVSAVIYGCMPLMAKWIYADGVNPMTLVFLRNALALPSLGALAFSREKFCRVPKAALPKIAVLAFLGCTLTPILLFSSYNHMASGTATVLHFIYPAMVVLGGIVFLRKKAQSVQLISVTLCVAGVALFYDPAQPLSAAGCAYALGSGVTFASYVLLLSRFDRSALPGLQLSFYVAAMSSAMTLLLCVLTGNLALPSSLLGWALCLLFAVAVTTGAVVLFQTSTFLIGGEDTAILSTLEPITSMLVGVWVFKETLTGKAMVGCALVILASILIAAGDRLKKK